MRRRDFLAVSCGLGLATTGLAAENGGQCEAQQFLELREYHLLPGEKKRQFHTFVRDALVPALNRLGIQPVGAFQPKYGQNKPTLYLLLPHATLESFVTLSDRLLADQQFLQDGADVLDTSISDPAFVRIESCLLRAFHQFPKVAVPPQKAEDRPRIFELRTYESHSLKAAKKKIEMFNEGGEISIFLKTGLQPVFFGEMLIGPRMPNLTYMLVFDDMTARDAAWKNFLSDPDWDKLKRDPQYKDTVSNITDVILQPTGYSQL